MLIQMSKLCGYSLVVGVVGSRHKVVSCLLLGADVVIDKKNKQYFLSQEYQSRCPEAVRKLYSSSFPPSSVDSLKNNTPPSPTSSSSSSSSSLSSLSYLWSICSLLSPTGYVSIFDANGIDTLSDSYSHLSRCGRLIIYGFHTNVPLGSSYLNPWNWMNMAYSLFLKMPSFQPMEMVTSSKTVSGFNLSFFAEETDLIHIYMSQIISWLERGEISLSQVSLFEMKDIGNAHELIQSGSSIGKIILQTGK